MNKVKKGTYGYLQRKGRQVLLQTLLFFGLAAAVLIIGIISTGTRKNLLTIIAVLGCLPACKSLVNLIMYLRAKGCSPKAHEEIERCTGALRGMYDLYFTSYKTNFAISHLVIEGKNLCGYTESSAFDEKAFTEHITTMLSQGGYPGMTVKIFRKLPDYCERLTQLNRLSHEKNEAHEDGVVSVLFDITL